MNQNSLPLDSPSAARAPGHRPAASKLPALIFKSSRRLGRNKCMIDSRIRCVFLPYDTVESTPCKNNRAIAEHAMTKSPFAALVESDPAVLDVQTTAAGPTGALPLTEELLREAPSGDLFGWTQNAGMGWNPSELNRREFLILSTSGGLRNPDGTPAALGYQTGHWEVGLLMKAAAEQLRSLGCIPFAGFCTDPCDGRTQGTPGMMDS